MEHFSLVVHLIVFRQILAKLRFFAKPSEGTNVLTTL